MTTVHRGAPQFSVIVSEMTDGRFSSRDPSGFVSQCFYESSWIPVIPAVLFPPVITASVSAERMMAWAHFLFLSVHEDSWNSIKGGAVPACCRLLRLIALIICWTQRRIYSSFNCLWRPCCLSVCVLERVFYFIPVMFGRRLEWVTNWEAKRWQTGVCEVILTLVTIFYFNKLNLSAT